MRLSRRRAAVGAVLAGVLIGLAGASASGESEVRFQIRRLASDDVQARRDAAAALDELGDARAVAPLLAALADADAVVRAKAASALGRLRDARAVAPLVAALNDGNGFVHFAAASALVDIGGASVDPLVALLKADDMWQRWRAAFALGQLGDARAEAPLKALQAEDGRKPIQQVTAEALRKLAVARAAAGPSIETLLADLRRADVETQTRAARQLSTGVLQGCRVAHRLEAVRHRNALAMREIDALLAAIKTPQANPPAGQGDDPPPDAADADELAALVTDLGHRDAEVVLRARQALAGLGDGAAPLLEQARRRRTELASALDDAIGLAQRTALTPPAAPATPPQETTSAGTPGADAPAIVVSEPRL